MASVGPSRPLRGAYPQRLSYEAEERLAIENEGTLGEVEPVPTTKAHERANDDRSTAEPAPASPVERAYSGVLGGRRIDTEEIFAPLPPMRWVVSALQLGPGRPAMLLGYGGCGKTIAAQSLALSIASERPVWGEFAPSDVARRVLHLDFDQGSLATCKRYQRLAIGLGIDRSELGSRLVIAAAPTVYLNSNDAVDAYAQAADGFDLVILDALRGATPGVDENDSKIRACVDVGLRVSERTGATMLLLHHSGKKDLAEGNPRTAGRGSSAIFDGCGTVFAMSAERRSTVRIVQTKAAAEAEGALMDDFHLSIEDVPQADNPLAGVAVSYRRAPAAAPGNASDEGSDAMRARVLDYVRAHPGVNGKQAVCTGIGGDGRTFGLVRDAVESLLADGSIQNRGSVGRPRYHEASRG